MEAVLPSVPGSWDHECPCEHLTKSWAWGDPKRSFSRASCDSARTTLLQNDPENCLPLRRVVWPKFPSGPQDRLLSSHGCWMNSVPGGCRSEVLTVLLALGWELFSAPRSCPEGLAPWPSPNEATYFFQKSRRISLPLVCLQEGILCNEIQS